MRHRKLRRKLGVKSDHRKALLRNLVRNLVQHKRIRTTVARAREASAYLDKLVTIAKRGDLHARRLLVAKLGCAETAGKLMKDIVPFLQDRNSGYTRVLRCEQRRGDGAQLALWEFSVPVESPESKKKKEKKAKKKEKAEKKTEADEAPVSKKGKGKEVKPEQEDKAPKSTEKETPAEEKKESEKRGGFLGTLRKFLKGDE